MTGIDVLQAALGSTKLFLTMYLGDLSDADILVRPAPNANHIAWQLGHLIKAERAMVLEQLPAAVMPALPAGFTDAHSNERATFDGSTGYLSKAEYVKLFDDIRSATMAAVAQLTDADLDRPSVGNMAPMAPKLADMFLLMASHTLMHAGQFTVVRRILGKPVLF